MYAERRILDTSSLPPPAALLGIAFHPLTREVLLSTFSDIIRQDHHNLVVGSLNLHSLAMVQEEEAMKRFYKRADLVYVDGMSIVWLSRLFGIPLRRDQRCTYLDWCDNFFRMLSENECRVFYLGGRRESVPAFAAALKGRYPTLQFMLHHGYLDDTLSEEVRREIKSYSPNVILVGMGMPVQEKWIESNEKHFSAKIIMAGGAMLEYLAGEKIPAPRWMGRFGLEWLHRLLRDPGRLAHRYLIEPLALIPLIYEEWRKG